MEYFTLGSFHPRVLAPTNHSTTDPFTHGTVHSRLSFHSRIRSSTDLFVHGFSHPRIISPTYLFAHGPFPPLIISPTDLFPHGPSHPRIIPPTDPFAHEIFRPFHKPSCYYKKSVRKSSVMSAYFPPWQVWYLNFRIVVYRCLSGVPLTQRSTRVL